MRRRGRLRYLIRERLTLEVAIRELDEDTAMVVLTGESPATACLNLHEALRTAESLGKPGLVINLSDLDEANHDVLAAIGACQHRCIEAGRWLLVVPPQAMLATPDSAAARPGL